MIPKKRSGPIWPILVALTLTVTPGAIGAKANPRQALFNVYFAPLDPAGKTLTEVERRRVEALTHLLLDAGTEAIYSGLPAWPAAEQIGTELNIKANFISRKLEVTDDIVRRLRTEHTGRRVLIVAGNTVPEPHSKSLRC